MVNKNEAEVVRRYEAEGWKTLRGGVLVLTIIFSIAMILSYAIATLESSDASRAWNNMTQADKQIIERYYNLMPNYDLAYTAIGWLSLATWFGLIFLCWHVRTRS